MKNEQAALELEALFAGMGVRVVEVKPDVLCFGCIGQAGHYLHEKRGHESALRPVRTLTVTPWSLGVLDGGLLRAAKVRDMPDGAWTLARKDGWTAISFWDRSGDSRGNSSTTFLVAADVSAERLLELARAQWPEVFARPGFPILRLP